MYINIIILHIMYNTERKLYLQLLPHNSGRTWVMRGSESVAEGESVIGPTSSTGSRTFYCCKSLKKHFYKNRTIDIKCDTTYKEDK